MPIDTYPENTAFLLGHGNGYSAEHFQALRKIRVTGGDHEILATLALALADDEAIIGHGEIGLGEQAFRRLGLPEGAEGYPVSQSFLWNNMGRYREQSDGARELHCPLTKLVNGRALALTVPSRGFRLRDRQPAIGNAARR